MGHSQCTDITVEREVLTNFMVIEYIFCLSVPEKLKLYTAGQTHQVPLTTETELRGQLL